jgi:protein-S-isoprenylcysteine O-methyltransferase Ste14
MIHIETLVEILATILGIVALIAPLFSVLRQAQRPRGRSSGRAAGSRTWPIVFLTTIGFAGMGIVLWKPFPLNVSPQMAFLIMVVGALLYFPGVGLYLWGLVTMRSQFGVSGLLGAELYREHELITSGPFAIIRHPMYAGVLLAATGALLIFRTWAMGVFMPMSLVVVLRAQREENLLEQEFGDEWRSYASKVPKWFPRL